MSMPSRHTMVARRVGGLLAILLAGSAAVLVPAAQAARPAHVSFPVYVTYEVTELTEICGFEIWFTLEGTFKGILFLDRAGQTVGEFDSQPNTWFELSAPSTGEEIRVPFATTFHTKYPEGVDPGDRVVTTATGFYDKIPGLSAAAGLAYFPDGEVVEVVDGVPYVNYGNPTIERGHQPDYSEADAAICTALTS